MEPSILMGFPLSERKKILKKTINVQKQSLEIIEGIETYELEKIDEEFESAMKRNEEGIMLKTIDSFYVPNERGIN